jgi:hypothetical protein
VASQIINLKASGLQTYYQTLMEISPGALLKANNVVIDRDGVIEPRRGIKTYSPTVDKVKQLLEYKGRLIRHVQDTLAYDDGTGTFTNFYGLYDETETGSRIKSVEAKNNLYFTTAEGIKKISAKTPSDFTLPNIVEDSGGPKAIAGILQLNPLAGFLPLNNSSSYRILWTVIDRNNNLIFGSPSASMTITNTSIATDCSVDLSFQIPYNVTLNTIAYVNSTLFPLVGDPSKIYLDTTNNASYRWDGAAYEQYNKVTEYKYRVYRSEIAVGTPSDELYQVYEGTPTAADLENGYIDYTDSLAESLRIGGVPLYTNQYGGEGILKSNEPPPAAKDIALFKGHMFYANTRTRHSATFTILDLSTFTAGVSDLIISANTYIFDTTEDIVTKKVLISTNPNPQLAIEETARSLVTVINGDPNEIISAYYLSVFGETQGKILLQRKTVVDNAFYLGTTDNAIITSFTPELGTPLNILTKFTSSAETNGNRLYYSKYQEVEAVPILNYIDIGSTEQDILRIIPLRESLFILKADGVFRLAGDPGSNPTWDVGAFDTTSIIKAPDTAVTLSNQCYYFSNQGIVRLNESSLEPISRPIENKLLPFITTNANLAQASFAVPYESDRSLLVWTVLTKTDTFATVCYRYNTLTNTWTEWKIPKLCGILKREKDNHAPDNKLYFGSALDNYVEVERKNFDRFDYADRQIDITLTPSSLDGIIIKPTGFSNIAIEDVILQEQYVTIYQFNSLLKQLDNDNGLLVHNFYDELKMSNGENLTAKMNSLVAKLDIADPTAPAYSTLWTSPLNFQTIQTQFNNIVDKLNASPVAYLSNYRKSLGTTSYEAIITDLNRLTQQATLNIPPSFMVGALVLYKGIKTEVEYAPQHAGTPASQKQFSTGTFMFERRSFHIAQVAYNSDLSDSYEEILFSPNSAGVFGGATWGDGTVWGGLGDQAQIDTYIPLRKQRCRFLGCKFIHGVALDSFQLYGLSLSVKQYAIPNRNK